MPNKKVYIILITIIVVFGIVMFLLFGVKNIQQENLESVLVVGENTTWTYQNKRWLYLRYNTSMEKLNWTKFHVLEDDKEIGSYYLWHDDKWYVFDNDNNAVQIDGNLIAYDANYEMKVLSFQEETVDDYTYVYSVLQENGLSTSSKFTSIYKVPVDFDGDSITEDLYVVSNVFPLDFEPDTSFSIAFMVKNNMIYYLYTDVSSNRGLNGCKPFYHTFIDTNYDGIYEVILSCGRYSAAEQVDMLYQFSDNNFNLLISNQ